MILLFVVACAALTFSGFHFVIVSAQSLVGIKAIITTAVGILAIALFGLGGLAFLVLVAWKPIVVASERGVTVPFGWGENFTTWRNIRRIAIVEQRINGVVERYVGIYVRNAKGLVGVGRHSKNVAKALTGWEKVPDMLINLSFSFARVEDVRDTLEKCRQQYCQTVVEEKDQVL